MDGPEITGSESSSSSAANREIPATNDGRVVKREPSYELDDEETSDAAMPPVLPSQSPQTTLPSTPMNVRQRGRKSSTTGNASSSNGQASDHPTPLRVTRKSSRESTLKTINSTPTNPMPAKMVTMTVSSGSVAVNQNRSTPHSAVKQRRQSTSQEPAVQSFQCKQCSYTTAWKCSYVRHLLIHNDSSIDLERLQCEKCAHLTKPSSGAQPSTCDSESSNNVENPAFACNLCLKKFAAKDLLDMHYSTIHRHQCAKCKKKFANAQQADAHKKRRKC